MEKVRKKASCDHLAGIEISDSYSIPKYWTFLGLIFYFVSPTSMWLLEYNNNRLWVSLPITATACCVTNIYKSLLLLNV